MNWRRNCAIARRQETINGRKKGEKRHKVVSKSSSKKGLKKPREIQDLLNLSADMVIEERIKSATVDIDGKVKAKISMTAEGNIKIERTETAKRSEEA